MENSDRDKNSKKLILPKTETVSEPCFCLSKRNELKKNHLFFRSRPGKDNYLYWLSLTPEERIANVTRLIREI
jgi:hypothetical protein